MARSTTINAEWDYNSLKFLLDNVKYMKARDIGRAIGKSEQAVQYKCVSLNITKRWRNKRLVKPAHKYIYFSRIGGYRVMGVNTNMRSIVDLGNFSNYDSAKRYLVGWLIDENLI